MIKSRGAVRVEHTLDFRVWIPGITCSGVSLRCGGTTDLNLVYKSAHIVWHILKTDCTDVVDAYDALFRIFGKPAVNWYAKVGCGMQEMQSWGLSDSREICHI